MRVPLPYRTYFCTQVNDIGVMQVSLQSLGNAGRDARRGGSVCLRIDEVERAIDTNPSLSSLRAILDYENFRGIAVVEEGPPDPTHLPCPSLKTTRIHASGKHRAGASRWLPYGVPFLLLSPLLIQIHNNTKAPYEYSISIPIAHLVLAALSSTSGSSMDTDISTLRSSRTTILQVFPAIPNIRASI
ncbi:hypothetical protein BDQ12DRAFT_737538 [Crucibulum laeve]|uniref:Uncharacterized protein n=1 Tax=Crucibulum laeve TaxID=68775 RepID=A0A5C3LRP3_9AGAR|nr:hypothetical protein BDQ12DRAFT_737538 [Crucibulum laeve]